MSEANERSQNTVGAGSGVWDGRLASDVSGLCFTIWLRCEARSTDGSQRSLRGSGMNSDDRENECSYGHFKKVLRSFPSDYLKEAWAVSRSRRAVLRDALRNWLAGVLKPVADCKGGAVRAELSDTRAVSRAGLINAAMAVM